MKVDGCLLVASSTEQALRIHGEAEDVISSILVVHWQV